MFSMMHFKEMVGRDIWELQCMISLWLQGLIGNSYSRNAKDVGEEYQTEVLTVGTKRSEYEEA